MLFELVEGHVIVHEGNSSDGNTEQQYYTHGYAQPLPRPALPLQLPDWGCITQALISPRHFHVLTDHAGAYPLYEAKSKTGSTILGSDAWQVAKLAGLSALNSAACFDMLAFEYVPGHETLLAGLTEITPATRMTFLWTGSRWERLSETVWALQRRESTSPVSEAAALENLLEAVRPMASFRGASAGETLAVNLSGGWDSRAVLAAAIKTHCGPIRACSYGNPEYPGVQIAKKIAHKLSIPHSLNPFVDGSFLMRNHQLLCSLMPPVTRFNLADGALAMGTNSYDNCWGVTCGHSGDFFTNLPAGAGSLQTKEDLSLWIRRHMRSAFAHDLGGLLKPSYAHVPEQINHRVRATVDPLFSPGTEGVFLWYFQNRVRRAAAIELRMLERFSPVVFVPMLEKTFIEFWMTVPDGQLKGRQLYRRMLNNQLFTDIAEPLASIPRESGTALSPDAHFSALKDAARDNYFRVLRRIAPSSAAKMTAADPTALWWQNEPQLRAWAWKQLEESPFVIEHFNMDRLRALASQPTPSDPSFSRIGLWNLLTIPGIEATCAAM